MLRSVYKFLFNKFGWKIIGGVPNDLKKYIIVVAPHTSNWDFIVGVAARSIVSITHVKYLAKKELFKWPYGFLFRWLGGYPVDRSKKTNLVEAVVAIFNAKEQFAIAVAPEGTRSKVNKLKTGFYHIARLAKVPIILVGFDYQYKNVIVKPPFYTTGNEEKDLVSMLSFFITIHGKNPELGLG